MRQCLTNKHTWQPENRPSVANKGRPVSPEDVNKELAKQTKTGRPPTITLEKQTQERSNISVEHLTMGKSLSVLYINILAKWGQSGGGVLPSRWGSPGSDMRLAL